MTGENCEIRALELQFFAQITQAGTDDHNRRAFSKIIEAPGQKALTFPFRIVGRMDAKSTGTGRELPACGSLNHHALHGIRRRTDGGSMHRVPPAIQEPPP